MPLSSLQPWSFNTDAGLTLRGWQSPPSGKPVLHFLHGNGFDSRVYWPLLSQFVNDYDLVLSHAQGHGGSDCGRRFLGYDRNAELLAQWLQQLKAQRPGLPWIAMGHSFGGILSTLIASRQPQLFDQLILLDPVFMAPPLSMATRQLARSGLMEYSPMARQARARRTRWGSREEARDYFAGRGVFRGWTEAALDAYLDYGLSHDNDGVELLTPSWLEAQIFARHDYRLWPAIRALKPPVHILRGADSFGFIKPATRLAARMRNISEHVVAGGHCFMQQFPEDTAALCLRLMGNNAEIAAA